MANQQLTLLDIPTHTPTSQWELENEQACDHNWVPSTGKYGLFAWRCQKCWEKRNADIFKDQNYIIKSAQSFKRTFEDYYSHYERSRTEKDKKRFLIAAIDRYWKARIEFLRVGIDRPLAREDFESVNPCPRELLPIYEILTQKSSLNEWGKTSKDEVMDTSESFARGKIDVPDGTLTKITPSTKTRRKKGEGTGYLFSKQVNRKGKTYTQWWYQYEEKFSNGQRGKRTVYVAKAKLDRVHSMNRDKLPVATILETIGKKGKI